MKLADLAANKECYYIRYEDNTLLRVAVLTAVHDLDMVGVGYVDSTGEPITFTAYLDSLIAIPKYDEGLCIAYELAPSKRMSKSECHDWAVNYALGFIYEHDSDF